MGFQGLVAVGIIWIGLTQYRDWWGLLRWESVVENRNWNLLKSSIKGLRSTCLDQLVGESNCQSTPSIYADTWLLDDRQSMTIAVTGGYWGVTQGNLQRKSPKGNHKDSKSFDYFKGASLFPALWYYRHDTRLFSSFPKPEVTRSLSLSLSLSLITSSASANTR